jgi:hypothetical protein
MASCINELMIVLSVPLWPPPHLLVLPIPSTGTLFIAAVPVDGGKFQGPLFVEVLPIDTIIEIHDRIRHKFQKVRLLGNHFVSDLEIRPIPESPTFRMLNEQTPDSLLEGACWAANDLPSESVGSYFHSLCNPTEPNPHINFVVWLPPEPRPCFPHHYIDPN